MVADRSERERNFMVSVSSNLVRISDAMCGDRQQNRGESVLLSMFRLASSGPEGGLRCFVHAFLLIHFRLPDIRTYADTRQPDGWPSLPKDTLSVEEDRPSAGSDGVVPR